MSTSAGVLAWALHRSSQPRRTLADPSGRMLVAKWLLRAEGAAGLPKLAGSVAHAYRRLWATERKTLPDVDVAATGGWKSTRALKLSYQHADPATALRVVENA